MVADDTDLVPSLALAGSLESAIHCLLGVRIDNCLGWDLHQQKMIEIPTNETSVVLHRTLPKVLLKTE